MAKYVYTQTIIQHRQEVREDGTLSLPKMVKAFTKEMTGSGDKYVRKNDPKVKKENKAKKQEELIASLQMKVSTEKHE